MPFIVAVESDAKNYKEIQENWVDVARDTGHEILLFKSIADMDADFAKPENASRTAILVMVNAESVTGDLTTVLNGIKEKYRCDLLLTAFDDKTKPIKNIEKLPVHNVIYKPFDLTILKEHTRFAILRGQKLKSMYVHTTQSPAIIESLKRFKILQLSEFAFKISKSHKLDLHKCYKFYHPLFANKKQQHAWGRVINATGDYYELLFSQNKNPVLAQLRRRVATSTQKVKAPNWIGLSENTQNALVVGIQIQDEPTQKSLEELLSRNFKDFFFILNKEIDPKTKLSCDVLITEMDHDQKSIEAQFEKKPLVIRVFEKDIERVELEKRFETEFIRMEKPIDKALLVKYLKYCFPQLVEGDEEIQRITATLDEPTMIAEELLIQDFSEASISFTDIIKHELGEIMEIALPKEDEANIQEIKARVNFAADKPEGPSKEKVYNHQFVLFGMRDELLKSLRLWALQKHIAKKK